MTDAAGGALGDGPDAVQYLKRHAGVDHARTLCGRILIALRPHWQVGDPCLHPAGAVLASLPWSDACLNVAGRCPWIQRDSSRHPLIGSRNCGIKSLLLRYPPVASIATKAGVKNATRRVTSSLIPSWSCNEGLANILRRSGLTATSPHPLDTSIPYVSALRLPVMTLLWPRSFCRKRACTWPRQLFGLYD